MRYRNRILCLLLAAAMLAGLAACARQEMTEEKTPVELSSPADPAASGADGDAAFAGTGTEKLNGFAARSLPVLFADLGGENRVFSPLNVYMAFSMLAEVTDGESRAELLALLGCDSMDELHGELCGLWEASYRDEEDLTVLPAASIWLRSDSDYRSEALDALAAYDHASAFSGTMGSESYDRMLRDWINERTKRLLEEQAEHQSLKPDTVIALVTTLYFKSGWREQFTEALTKREIFHAADGERETDFMHRRAETRYYRGDGFGAIRLNMDGGAAMWLLLPDEGRELQALIDSGAAMDFLCAGGDWEESVQARVNISLPRFDVDDETSLLEAMRALGVTAALDPSRSDFSPLTDEPGLSVTKATHAARVKIDENGCEAAAFTVIVVEKSAAPEPEGEIIDFICDRPFLFAVTGSEGQLLFVGAVSDPAK